TVNLSCRHVCHFETGPQADRALVLKCKELLELDPILIAEALNKVIEPEFQKPMSQESLYWDVVRGLYLGEPYPRQVFRITGLILSRCIDFLPKVIAAYSNPTAQSATQIISEFDQLLQSYSKSYRFMKVF